MPLMPLESASHPVFVGKGEIPSRSWWRAEGDEVRYVPPPRILPLGHPAAYEASDELVAAVDTALVLKKPLLVTGRPGTGKTELAERIAYEFGLGPVLRFEAQSLSEAGDLFYRFDHIGQLIAARLVESGRGDPEDADVMNFVQFGPLGEAILRSAPEMRAMLVGAGPEPEAPRRSVVLIDEIDKASRDFPNDLLNGIDRMAFRLRELGSREVRGAGRESPLHPIVVVTSNSERDLPHPFMRRCVYAHIEDPKRPQLAAIVRRRVFGDPALPPEGSDGLPPLYSRLLDAFVELRDGGDLRYPIGTSEFLDLVGAARRQGIDGRDTGQLAIVRLARLVGAIAKHPADRERVLERFAAIGV